MSKFPSKHRSAKRDALKRAVFRGVANELGIRLAPIGAPVQPVVRRKAALDLALRQIEVAVSALSKLGGALYHEALATDGPNRQILHAKSEAAWRLSRLFRRCQQSLSYRYDPGRQALRVQHEESCKAKVCPLCTRVKSRQRWHDATAAVTKIRAEQPHDKFVLLTLTKPKSSEDTLPASLRELSRNVTRLLNKPQLKRVVRGYLLTVEINYDPSTDLYHDHAHLLLHVPGNYGPDRPDLWVSQQTLVRLWSRLYGTEQKLVVDVRFAGTADKGEIGKSMAELCKYLSSPVSLFKRNPDQPEVWACHARAMLTLAMATQGVRLMRCGGSIAAARRALKASSGGDSAGRVVEDE